MRPLSSSADCNAHCGFADQITEAGFPHWVDLYRFVVHRTANVAFSTFLRQERLVKLRLFAYRMEVNDLEKIWVEYCILNGTNRSI